MMPDKLADIDAKVRELREWLSAYDGTSYASQACFGAAAARCLPAILDALAAKDEELKRLKEPGTIEARLEGVLEFAERECGHNPHSATAGESVLMERFLAMREELKAARAVIDNARAQCSIVQNDSGGVAMILDYGYLAQYGEPKTEGGKG